MATKDYEAIARAKIHRPASVTRPPRVLIYSRNKKGKTRLSTTAPNVLILDPEGGTDTMKRLNPHVWKVETWPEFNDVYHFLKRGKHEYDWVSVDGCTRFSNMSLRYVMGLAEERDLERKPGMVQKQDYGKSGELMKGMLHNFHSLNMGVIFTAQERMEEASDSEEDEDSESAAVRYVPDMPKGVRGTLNSIVDVIGRLYTVRVEKKVRDPDTRKIVTLDEMQTQRRLWLEPSVQYDTGYRSDYELPRFLKNPTIPKLLHLIDTGKIAPTKKEQ